MRPDLREPVPAPSYVAQELGRRRFAFIYARESLGEKRIGPQLKALFGGTYIANEKFTFATGNQVLAAGRMKWLMGCPLLPTLICRRVSKTTRH